ncbi:Uncharacterized membrane protein YeiB [Georgenia satyanarayanai]|uniref:Uncharacterized membrane protein YeiB n=1 Tax=Georgenia satyanarayanai TaxID=860221 RepID=A0A2Y9AQL3_9MICO|nr:DUF418 domain-containing protein [Georgenia satyanarayanai]PYF97260.1 putative membrane protein YeiB [Georgenia satyanarayanai]SSA46346.1 Uncharacterized membrane protein YeiB [Georgenia satyanarayanai]
MNQRIVGVDIARGLAVIGMFVAHLGNSGPDGSHSPSWFVVADGRPSATFAILAGLSIALFTGGRMVPRGPALTHGWLRVATRAGVVLVVGLLLEALGTPVAVILPSYAVTFLLVALFIGLRPWLVGVLAVVAAVVGPTLLAVLLSPGADGSAPVESEVHENYLLDLVLTGYYPALVWIAYMLLGLCVGRLDLRSPRVQGLLGLTGVGLALVGYGGGTYLRGTVVPDSELTAQLIRSDPHSDATLELVGNAGVTLAVLAVLLAVTTLPPVARGARLLLQPLAATGAMALTAYSVHIVVIAILGNDVVWFPESNAVLAWFVVVTLVACTLWMRLVGRGPLEWLMRRVTVGSYRPVGAAV